MGYSSKVAFVLTEDDFNELMERLNEVDAISATTFKAYAKRMTTPDEVYIKTESNWCKWYDEIPDVKVVMDFLKGVRHSYVRIGEDDTDFEVDRKSWDDRGTDEEFEYFLEPVVDIGDYDFCEDLEEVAV